MNGLHSKVQTNPDLKKEEKIIATNNLNQKKTLLNPNATAATRTVMLQSYATVWARIWQQFIWQIIFGHVSYSSG